MRFIEKKVKVFVVTLVAMLAAMLEFGILEGFMFSNKDTAVNGLTYAIKTIPKDLGWNYIIMSLIVLLLSFLWSFYLGYNRNAWGLAALVLVSCSPYIGLITMYNIFYGWGTAHLIPFMQLIGLTTASRGLQLLYFGAITILYPVMWFFGKAMRKIASAK